MNLSRLLVLVLVLIFAACSPKFNRYSGNYRFTSAEGAPNYAQLDYWAAHPYKNDPSDSVPAPLRANYRPDSLVDVFFIHPTTYTAEEKKTGWNARTDDAELNAKTDFSPILYQASIFNEVGRVFAPRYRQAHLSAYYPRTKEDTIAALNAFNLAYSDVKNAFLYYLQNENKGRPIIIASHSQGSTHAQRLLLEFFDNALLYNKLVAAYIPGMYVNTEKFVNIHPCQTPHQTGCMVGWRTYREGYVPEFVEKEKGSSLVTNPITWDSSRPTADRFENKGAILLKFNKLISLSTAANIHDRVLWTPRPVFFGSSLYKTENYHAGDFNLYYVNVRENLQVRLSAFWKK
ncbi:MAG: DUF3089 domain-containing protein [Bacteroidota bacterium]